MEAPWTLTNGPEYAESAKAARAAAPDPIRFDGQLQTLRRYIELFPHDGKAFGTHGVRVREMLDEALRYRLAGYYVLHADRWICELKFVDLVELDG